MWQRFKKVQITANTQSRHPQPKLHISPFWGSALTHTHTHTHLAVSHAPRPLASTHDTKPKPISRLEVSCVDCFSSNSDFIKSVIHPKALVVRIDVNYRVCNRASPSIFHVRISWWLAGDTVLQLLALTDLLAFCCSARSLPQSSGESVAVQSHRVSGWMPTIVRLCIEQQITTRVRRKDWNHTLCFERSLSCFTSVEDIHNTQHDSSLFPLYLLYCYALLQQISQGFAFAAGPFGSCVLLGCWLVGFGTFLIGLKTCWLVEFSLFGFGFC